MKRRSFLRSLAAALIAGEVAQRLLLTEPAPTGLLELCADPSLDGVVGSAFDGWRVGQRVAVVHGGMASNSIGTITEIRGNALTVRWGSNG